MRIESLDCNNCGAPVDVPENVQFMRCGHCGSRLKVHRETSAHYTEVLGQIEESTRELKSEVRALRLQNEIRDLDDAWRVKREGLMVRGKDGSASQPSAVGGVIGGLLAGGFGIFWTIMAASMGAPGFFVLFGVIFVIGAIGMGIYSISHANEYQQAEAQYREERRRLEERMERERSGGNGG